MQFPARPEEYWPAAHDVQVGAALEEYWPAGQLRHVLSEFVLGMYWPAWQLTHDPSSRPFWWYCPAAHLGHELYCSASVHGVLSRCPSRCEQSRPPWAARVVTWYVRCLCPPVPHDVSQLPQLPQPPAQFTGQACVLQSRVSYHWLFEYHLVWVPPPHERSHEPQSPQWQPSQSCPSSPAPQPPNTPVVAQ